MRVWFAFAFLGLIRAQSVKVDFLPHEVIEQRLRAYTLKNATRETAIRTLFEEAGCKDDSLSEQKVKGTKSPNLICTSKGETGSIIIVGAHFDLIEKGQGVVDNWSGCSLLPSFYQGLMASARKHTFVLIAFAGEEQGLLGSQAFVKQLGAERPLVKAMVNLDTLGLGMPQVWLSHSDRNLANWLARVAKQLDIPLGVVNVDRVGTTDSESFREKQIPAITVHSVTQETLRVLHSPQDKIEAMQMEPYYQTYKLLISYLAALDQILD
jgi:Iap family predicted aminopeptidase